MQIYGPRPVTYITYRNYEFTRCPREQKSASAVHHQSTIYKFWYKKNDGGNAIIDKPGTQFRNEAACS